jgi:hypothetical protein
MKPKASFLDVSETILAIKKENRTIEHPEPGLTSLLGQVFGSKTSSIHFRMAELCEDAYQLDNWWNLQIPPMSGFSWPCVG